MTDFLETEPFNLTPEEVKELIKREPSEKNEFFPSIPTDNSDLAITAGAMANIGGGYITVGVTETGDVVGVTDPDLVDEIVQFEIFEYVEQSDDFTIKKTSCEIEDHDVMVIKVVGFKQLPVTVDGRFYKRAGRKNRFLSPPEVRDYMARAIDESN